MLYIYNTLSQRKELFKPLKPPHVGLYVCGLTVYDECHIGHGRLFIWFDIVVRYLRHLGFKVTYVRNITDIDDKIINRAHTENLTYQELAAQMIASMHADTEALKIIPPDLEPRVTAHIPQIIAMIQILISKGYAYRTATGDIYYDITKFTSYGEFAHQDIESLRSGARVEIDTNKHDPLDFVLWKAAKPLEPAWPSPWGEGRPGWHIECSAMAKQYLGTHFDIHGGGCDLQFPHHQNELAQSEAANSSPFVNYWMHMGFVQIQEEKMSKSLGNSLSLKELRKRYDPELLRYFMLTSHYRSAINFSQANLAKAAAALSRLYITLRGLPSTAKPTQLSSSTFATRFYAAMNDDFNTPEALALLFELAHEVNRLRSAAQLSSASQHAALLKQLGTILGILQQDPEKFLQAGVDEKQIRELIAARTQARKQRDWITADQLRAQLKELGVALEDTPTGTTWVREPLQTKNLT